MITFIYYSHPEVENLYPLTEKNRSVPNIKLLGKPLAFHIISRLRNSSFEKKVIYPNIEPQVFEAIGRSSYVVDIREGNAIESLRNGIESSKGSEVVVMMGSYLTGLDFIDGLLYTWNEKGGSMMVALVPNIGRAGIFQWDVGVDVEFISGAVKKAYRLTSSGEAPYIFSGIIASEKETLLKYLTAGQGSLVEIITNMINAERPSFYIYSGKYTPLGDAWSILEAIKTLLQEQSGTYISKEAKVSPTAIIEGPVFIDDGASVDHYAVIKGPVYLGKNSFVGAHSLVRNYASIEEQSVIGSGVEVKRSYLGPRTTVGSNCLVTDSVLGEGSTLKPFVVTLNYDPHEAKILGEAYIKRGIILGEYALIKGGTVLKPNLKIEPKIVYPQSSY